MRMTPRLIDSLYVEAMLLADEARAYFDDQGREERGALDPLLRVSFSCESLKVTTRLMHLVAWLLTERALDAGEMPPGPMSDAARRLGETAPSDETLVARLPDMAGKLIAASQELYARVARLAESALIDEPQPSPARGLMSRLERAF